MAKVFIEESTLTKIGNSIRNKTGKTDLIDPAVMDVEIDNIVSGGGGELPEEAFKIKNTLYHRFVENHWNWFVEEFGNRVSTENINTMFQAFINSDKLTKIPFNINIKNCADFSSAFSRCNSNTQFPKIRGTISFSSSTSFSNFLDGCNYLRDAEEIFDPSMLDGFSKFKTTSTYSTIKAQNIFNNCYSLRTVPTWFYKFKLNEESTAFPNISYVFYNYLFNANYSLDEAINIPVWTCAASPTRDMLSSMIGYCNRLKNFTFETQADGTPIVAKWQSQILDFGNSVGYVPAFDTKNITNYNSGITADKEVKDDATYQALKDDPDWFATSYAYSRYNHDSAVATINSLPDTSAYLATITGGTNTIRFSGMSGSKTDGGAINTLTAEEIAVATAKGWTVSIS